MKKYILRAIIFFILVFLIFWISAIAKCEILTLKHGNEFLEFEEVSTASKFKILNYNNHFARIYCVNFNRTNGSVHNFKKETDIWVYNAWEDGGWSKSGTADGFIWPYIR